MLRDAALVLCLFAIILRGRGFTNGQNRVRLSLAVLADFLRYISDRRHDLPDRSYAEGVVQGCSAHDFL